MQGIASVAGWIVGAFVGVLIFGALLVVRPDADRAAVTRKYAMADSRFLALSDGAVAHVRVSGPENAPAMVLLHGFASSAWAWDGWTTAFDKDHRVIRIDLLGHGLTKGKPGGGAWRSDQAQFVGEVLDALKVERAAVAGNSMGGGVAWSFAASQPERVTALVLIDSAGPSADGPPLRVRAMFRRWYSSALRFAFRWAGGTLLMGRGMRSGGGNADYVQEIDVRRADAFWRLHRAELLREMQSTPTSRSPSLDAVRAPTLVLQGGRDRLVPKQTAEALVAGIAGARLIEYPALGHTPHQEDPTRTAADVRAFLEANQPGSAK